MAVNYSDLTPGTALVWTSSGGDYTLSAGSLTNTSARQGGKSGTLIDGTKGFPELLLIVIQTKVPTATDGNTLDLYLAFSDNATAGTNNPGGLTGADGALSTPASVTPQLGFAGSLVISNAVGTSVVQQSDPFVIRPKAAYVIPVLVNNTGQTLDATGTNTKVTVTPYYRRTPIA